MKLNHAKKQLRESVTREDIRLWNEYCFDANADECALYAAEELPELLKGMELDLIGSFWEGLRASNIQGADYVTYAEGYFNGLSKKQVQYGLLFDPNFRKWKREHGYSTSAD